MFDLAIEQNSATLDHLYNCLQYMSDDAKIANIALDYYPKLVNSFENKWGKIRRFYHNDVSACITTENGFLFHIEMGPTLETLRLLHKCDMLSIESRRLLSKRDRLCCLDMQYEALSHLLGSFERLKSGEITEEDHSTLVNYIETEFENIIKQFTEGAQRRAVLEYYLGMFEGLGIILFIIIVMKLYSILYPSFFENLKYIYSSFFFGGVGAIISVIQRMSTGKFYPDKEADPSHNNRIGIFRTIIGSVMGVLVYFLIISKLIPLSLPSENELHYFYISSVAFSAGFTERWVQGMLPSINETKNNEENNS